MGAQEYSASGGSGSLADTTAIVKGSADATKLLRFEVDGMPVGTNVATPPSAAAFTIARTDAAQTFTGNQTVTGAVIASTGLAIGTGLTSADQRFINDSLQSGVAVVDGASSGLRKMRADGYVGADWVIGQTPTSGPRVSNLSSTVLVTNNDVSAYYPLASANLFLYGTSNTSRDTGLSRVAAGVVGIGTGTDGSVAGVGRATYYEAVVGASVASAATIAPTGGIFHVTGTTQITTISLPRAGFTGSIRVIPDGIFSTATGGNIAVASIAVVARLLEFCFDGTSWYPSY